MILFRTALLVVFAFMFVGCVGLSVSGFSDSAPEPGSLETVNHTSFPASVFLAEIDEGYFYSAILRVTLDASSVGRSAFAGKQTPAVNGFPISLACSSEKTALPTLVGFKKKAEIYLNVDSQQLTPDSAIILDTKAMPVVGTDGCNLFAHPGKPVLFPYLEEGTCLSLTGLKKGGDLHFTVPKDGVPYILVRYQSGAMVPAPMRLDTLFVDASNKKLELVYRGTFPVEPQVRKAELRWLSKGQKGWSQETLQQTKARVAYSFDYLENCPVPRYPIEECAKPQRVPAALFYGKHN